jgi:hypothetical protein
MVASLTAVVSLLWPTGDAGPDGTALRADPVSVATAEVVLDSRGWGTEVLISLQGVPERSQYVAWAVAGDGQREVVATWGPTGSGSMRVTGASSLRTEDVVEIQIVGDGDDDVLASARSSA